MAADLQKIAPYLWVKQNDPYATNSGLLMINGQACLIDPGISPAQMTEIKHFLDIHHAVVTTIILTHAHWDHLLGAAWFPEARVVAQQHYLDVIRDHRQHLKQQVAPWGASAGGDSLEWNPPIPTNVFSEAQVLTVSDIPMRLIHTPGHTPDHASVYLPHANLLWAGDMLSDLELPLVQDIDAYTRTLTALEALDVNLLVPGHGTPALEKPTITTRFNQDCSYLRDLKHCVSNAMAEGSNCAATVELCLRVPFAQPDEYPNAQQWNIESAYQTFGGAVDSPTGWDNEWV